MNSKVYFLFLIGSLLITGVVAGVAIYAIQTNTQLEVQSNKNTAINDCLNTSLYRYTVSQPNGSTIVTEEPIQTAVDKCLQLKGY